ncbi:hypothetical protein Acr_19g0003790 [Actinidia rufa]|uniref:Uncharacterized protein n=1 Tax=Actinidia rufa TaxID=165716 RepID=A0A7J0G9M4_9ERIC|nr:hypothetical protein Acr_19g0003790 [Actinidia rufa]
MLPVFVQINSPVHLMSPMGRNLSGHSESPVRGRGSPRRRSPSRRERSPARHRSSHKASLPPREKPEGRTRSPKREKSRSPVYRSPSPRTKRLRRIEAERGSEKVSEREHARNHNRAGDKATHRERGSDRDVPSEKKKRRSGRDASGSSKSRDMGGQLHHQIVTTGAETDLTHLIWLLITARCLVISYP